MSALILVALATTLAFSTLCVVVGYRAGRHDAGLSYRQGWDDAFGALGLPGDEA